MAASDPMTSELDREGIAGLLGIGLDDRLIVEWPEAEFPFSDDPRVPGKTPGPRTLLVGYGLVCVFLLIHLVALLVAGAAPNVIGPALGYLLVAVLLGCGLMTAASRTMCLARRVVATVDGLEVEWPRQRRFVAWTELKAVVPSYAYGRRCYRFVADLPFAVDRELPGAGQLAVACRQIIVARQAGRLAHDPGSLPAGAMSRVSGEPTADPERGLSVSGDGS